MLHMRPPGTGEPKKNSNAYMLFSTAMREAVKAESPGLTLGGVAKALGAKYKELSEEEKAHWQQKADEDKARRRPPLRHGRAGCSLWLVLCGLLGPPCSCPCDVLLRRGTSASWPSSRARAA